MEIIIPMESAAMQSQSLRDCKARASGNESEMNFGGFEAQPKRNNAESAMMNLRIRIN